MKLFMNNNCISDSFKFQGLEYKLFTLIFITNLLLFISLVRINTKILHIVFIFLTTTVQFSD